MAGDTLPAGGATDKEVVAIAEALLRLRERRDPELGADLFGEPAWDMLLDLLVAESRGRRLSPKSLGLGARCSPATGLRYIAALTRRGWISSVDDERDGRRRFISLSEDGRRRVVALLRSFAASVLTGRREDT